MLTKEHLKHRIRQNRVKPVFIGGTEQEKQLADRLISVFASAHGRSRIDIESDLAQIEDPLAPAFTKLLWDRTKDADDDGAVLESRWRVFEHAERLRRTGTGELTPLALRQGVGDRLGIGEMELAAGLYADLPECKSIASFRSLSGTSLIERYNCAQVQGLLFHATHLKVELKGTTLAERRAFFRHLKFRRLLALVETSPEDEQLTVTLTGPLALFDSAQTYGMRLAQFFPHILSLSRFKLTADLRLKRREVTLVLDQKCGIKSHYKNQTSFLPPELKECIEGFNAKFAETTSTVASANTDFLHLGNQSYCFPDIKIEGVNTQPVYIELFHRWHAHQLSQRVLAMQASSPLILGVSSQLAKGLPALKDVSYFTFREYPTPGQIKSCLVGKGAGL